MGQPFPNPVAGGGGTLVYPQICSPNFVHGVSGWQIAQDGSAEFHDIILPSGSGGATIYFASSAPVGANDGDLWYNTAAGLEVSQWNGSAWTPYQFSTGAIANGAITTPLIASGAVGTTQIASGAVTNALIAAAAVGAANIANGAVTATQINSAAAILGSQLSSSAGIVGGQVASGTLTAANIAAATITGGLIAANAITTGLIAAGAVTATQIAAGTITATQLAAGIVYAGIVNSTTINAATFTGSTFNGTDFIINTAGSFFYSGTPATGNLIASIAAASGTDAFGNAYPAGVQSTIYQSGKDTWEVILNDQLLPPGKFDGAAVSFHDLTTPAFSPAYFSAQGTSGAAPDEVLISTGQATSGDSAAGIQMNGSASSQSGLPEVTLFGPSASKQAVLTLIGGSGTLTAETDALVIWADTASPAQGHLNTGLVMPGGASGGISFNASAAGPFISGEGFHNITLASGMTGNLTSGAGLRVKMLPWNAIWLDWDFNLTTTGTTFTLGSLPSSAYYPVSARHFPSSSNGTPAGRVFVSTSGAVQFIVSSGVANVNYGGSVMYPTN